MEFGFPGHTLTRGDRAIIRVDYRLITVTGAPTVQGGTRDGHGYAEIVLPSLAPADRDDIRQAPDITVTLTDGQTVVYQSVRPLTVWETHLNDDGTLTVIASPTPQPTPSSLTKP
ncbi:hypothetical protein ACFW9D_05925 [Streptomyces sp. NPDC059524]|uniref:hypothetical protein n=1 Tax=Streptomyces sp. NPDC059524 TaxID=3346856 RepID=UPI0036A7641B